MKNYIKNSTIAFIPSLIMAGGTIVAIVTGALFVMPGTAMASNYGYGNYGGSYGGHNSGGYSSGYRSGGSSYYSDHNATYYPGNTNTNVSVNTTPTVITINNNNNVSGGGYAEPIYSQPIVYTQPVVYSEPIAYSTPNYEYGSSYSYGTSYAPTYYQDYSVAVPMNVSCSANAIFSPVGSMVLWTASVSGGNGYYTYQWSGSDQIYGSNSSIDVSYNTPGQKYAAVTVYSDGQSLTVNCSNIVTVGVPNYTNGNSYTNANPSVTPAPVAHYITRTVVHSSAPATASTVTAATSTSTLAANSLFSLSNIPWGWVAVLIILVLFGTVLY